MNDYFISIGILVIFLGGFFIIYPKARLSLVKNITLFLFVSIIGMIIIFQESIGGKILESTDFVGRIQRPIVEEFVAEKFGGTPLDSWYGFESFRPAVFVMIDQNGVQKKVALQAFTGEILKPHPSAVSDITFTGFLTQKNVKEPSPVGEANSKTQEKDTEPPKIEITFPKDGQVFDASTEKIIVTAEIWDAIDPSPVIDGVGEFSLQPGFNSIIVTGLDKSGNAGSAFVVVEKQ